MLYIFCRRLVIALTSVAPSHDSKPVVCLRARLRQDVANNSQSRFRRSLSTSSSCTRCSYVEDSREHMLLHCPAFSSSRSIAISKLSSLVPSVPFDVRTILGCYDASSHKPSKKRKIRLGEVLNITGEFLMAINNIMHRL